MVWCNWTAPEGENHSDLILIHDTKLHSKWTHKPTWKKWTINKTFRKKHIRKSLGFQAR